MSEKLPTLPTLDQFIAAYSHDWERRTYPPNLYVREKGFTFLYVRMGKRLVLKEEREPVLDLANFEVHYKGRGTFTKLVARLRHTYPAMPLYVESVLNVRFRAKLVALGFMPVPFDCFVLGA